MGYTNISSSSVHTVTEQIIVTTPIQVVQENHLISWGILWGGYLVASAVCAYQVFLDRRAVEVASDIEQGTGESSSGDTTRAVVRTPFEILTEQLCSRSHVLVISVLQAAPLRFAIPGRPNTAFDI